MLRRTNILTATALALCCALSPVAAAADQGAYTLNRDYGSPDAADAARDLRDATNSPTPAYSGPGFSDAERKLVESAEVQAMIDRARREIRATNSPSPAYSGPGFTDAERRLVESPEVQAMIDRARSEIRATPAVVEVKAPSGFDWGDAGIGAAGMLALACIGAGSALLIAGRRRRQELRVATH
jgi:hypothetical protein